MGEEAPILRDCLAWLKAANVLSWRCSLGGVRHAGVGRKKNPMKGFPDIGGCLRTGRFFVVECKAPKGRLTPEQIAWRDRLKSQGALYILATSVSDLESAFFEVLAAQHLGAFPASVPIPSKEPTK